MFTQIEEERFWELYLHAGILSGNSFNQWKAEAMGGNHPSGKQETDSGKNVDVEATIKQSNDILTRFAPS